MSKQFMSKPGRWVMGLVALFIAALIVFPNPLSSTRASSKNILRQASASRPLIGRPGQVPPLVSSSAYQGPKDPTETISLNLAFQIADQAGLQETLHDLYDLTSPNYHHWLTPQQFGVRFGRSPQEIQQASSWLTAQGLVVDRVLPNNLSILFSGTVDAVQRAFNVTLSQYSDAANDRIFYANDQEPVLPSDFSAITSDLVGLNDAYLRHPGKLNYRPANLKAGRGHRPTIKPLSGPASNAVDANGTPFMAPPDYATVYDITPLANAGIQGQGVKVGIIIDAAVSPGDAAEYRNFFNLPPANLQVIPVPNVNGKVRKDPSGELEASLDYGSVSAIAPLAEIDVVMVPEGQLTFANTLAAEEFVVNSVDTLGIQIINESFGGCESIAFNPAEEAVFDQGNAEGIAFFSSSGDNGAECLPSSNGGESESAQIACPNCYPGVTSVGGTSYSNGLLDTNGNILGIDDEVIWNNAPGAELNCKNKGTKGGGAGGGGISTQIAMPDFQTNATGFAGGPLSGSGRIVPDVSLLADPNSLPGVAFLNGNGFFVGGTSESSPLWAGMMALINQFKGGPQGAPNPELYRLGTIQYKNGGPFIFTDITEGNNSIAPITPCLPNGVTGFSAGTGFDNVSGWGAPDLNVLAHSYGQPTLQPITLPPPPPSITQITFAELQGDTLQIGVLATDPGEAVTSFQAALLDGSQTMLSPGSATPILVRHSATVGVVITLNGLSQMPLAENVKVLLTDKFGQPSQTMIGNFSGADPGGPSLTSATFSGNGLVVNGSGFAGKLFLEVNGVLVKKKGGGADSTKAFGGNQTALNLHSGPNRIRVETADGLFSNIFILQL